MLIKEKKNFALVLSKTFYRIKKQIFGEMAARQRRTGFQIYKEFLLFKKPTKSLKLILAKTIELEQFFPKMSKNWYTITLNILSTI